MNSVFIIYSRKMERVNGFLSHLKRLKDESVEVSSFVDKMETDPEFKSLFFLVIFAIFLGFSTIIIIYHKLISILLEGGIICYMTLLFYRFIVGFCFCQTKLNKVKVLSQGSNIRFVESKKGKRRAFVIGFTIPNEIEIYHLVKIFPRVVTLNV